MANLDLLQSEFLKTFSAPPEHIFRAPGRVNLIGEHTDYNAGFVLPMAIDRETLIAARARTDRTIRMVALDLHGRRSEFALNAISPDPAEKWSNYVRGVALMLQERGAALHGVDLAIHGNVPIGSGLSSSAALEVCVATTFQALSGFAASKIEIAQLCQKAENEFVGVNSGIMDQFVSALAKKGNALLLDCRDLSYEYVPMPEGATIVVCDTMQRRGLVNSEYNARRAECELAVRLLAEKTGRPLHTLRDVTVAELTLLEDDLPPNVAKRARHVITENERVLEAVKAMRQNDLAALGKLMDASHASLRDDYQVSSHELDTMVETGRSRPGCFGARLTGAGFGGCTVNLVRGSSVPEFMSSVAEEYSARTGLDPQIYACQASEGASLVV